ncbi:MAG: hypothetical protein IID03_12175 [Candidatus Dadabacteria bacterium]|nr:hypothetical protein [Candidatus Dadabacteria bacterium]
MFILALVIYFIVLTTMIAVYSSKNLERKDSRIGLAFFLGWPIFALAFLVIVGGSANSSSDTDYPGWLAIIVMLGPFFAGNYIGGRIDKKLELEDKEKDQSAGD